MLKFVIPVNLLPVPLKWCEIKDFDTRPKIIILYTKGEAHEAKF